MKKLLILSILFWTNAHATNYYVSATGNDAAAGTSQATAWQSLAKVNSMVSSFAAGDSIFFKCGDVFYGALAITTKSGTSGRPIVISSYGTGARPVFSGFTLLTGWTNAGGGIWTKNVPNAKKYTRMLTLNGIPQRIARYPNASAANGGYLKYKSSSSANNIIDPVNPILNKVGATVVTRPVAWATEPNVITGTNGDTIFLRIDRGINACCISPQMFPKKPNYGYFYQNDPSFLDEIGEYVVDSVSKDVEMYFGASTPSSFTLKIATVDTGINFGSRQYFVVNNINFEGYQSGIFAANGGYISVTNCDFNYMGARAIHFFNINDVVIDNVNTNYCIGSAIQTASKTKGNVSIKNVVVRNTAPYVGMDCWYDDSDGVGIYATVSSGLYVQNCKVFNVGKTAFNFQGSDVLVEQCLADTFMFNYGDRGGYYWYSGGTDASPGTEYTNRVMRNCYAFNGNSQELGTASNAEALAGFYFDGRTMNMLLQNCVAKNVTKNGVHCNNAKNITIEKCLFVNCGHSISFMKWDWGSITNLQIKNNIVYNSTKWNVYYTNAALNGLTLTQSLANVFMSNNYYNNSTRSIYATETYTTVGQGYLLQSRTLPQWQAISGTDTGSKDYGTTVPDIYFNPSMAPLQVNVTGLLADGTPVSGLRTINPFDYLFVLPGTIVTPPIDPGPITPFTPNATIPFIIKQ